MRITWYGHARKQRVSGSSRDPYRDLEPYKSHCSDSQFRLELDLLDDTRTDLIWACV